MTETPRLLLPKRPGEWRDPLNEVAVEAVVAALAVVRGGQQVRGIEVRAIEAGQVVSGDHEVGKAHQGVAGAALRYVDRDQDRSLVLLCALQGQHAGVAGPRAGAGREGRAADGQGAVASGMSHPAEAAWPVRARRLGRTAAAVARVQLEHLVEGGRGLGWRTRGERGSLLRRLVPLARRDRDRGSGRGRGRAPLRLGTGVHRGALIAGVAEQCLGEGGGKERRAAGGERGRVHVHVIGAGGGGSGQSAKVPVLPGQDPMSPEPQIMGTPAVLPVSAEALASA